MNKVLQFTILACLCGLGVYTICTTIMKEYMDYQSQGECIAEFIKTGVERKDIIVVNNTCEIRLQDNNNNVQLSILNK